MLKILRYIERCLDSLERWLLNRRNRELAPLSKADLKRMLELHEILERNSIVASHYYAEVSRILKTAYDLSDCEMPS